MLTCIINYLRTHAGDGAGVTRAGGGGGHGVGLRGGRARAHAQTAHSVQTLRGGGDLNIYVYLIFHYRFYLRFCSWGQMEEKVTYDI